MSRFTWMPRQLHRRLVALRDHARQWRQAGAPRRLRGQAVKRIIVGAGPTHYAGWVSTDMAAIDLLDPGTWERYVSAGTLDAILAEHVWEHLTPEQASTAAATCFQFLRPGGYVRVAVPDGNHPDPAYIADVRPGGSGDGSADHKVLYSHASLARVFEQVGFTTQALEYFDSEGAFQCVDWDPADGMVLRSKRFDRRNRRGLVYTSVVLDARKPVARRADALPADSPMNMVSAATPRPRVVVMQYRLLHYRVRLFELLRQRLAERDIELVLVHGQASARERLRKDEGHLDWALRVHNRFVHFAGKDLVWQPLPALARSAALCIVMQESRVVSNYVLQIGRWFSPCLVGFWGHGRNFQSNAPRGLRERWKGWWLSRVDWWFAYSASSVRHVVDHGFPPACVTNLENAIDGSGFARDLAAVPDALVDEARAALGLTAASQVAIYCGSLYADKRISVLLASAERLRQQLPDFHLIVIGEGGEAARVRGAAATWPWLHAVGSRTGLEKALYFRLASVMLNPGLVGLHVVDAFVARTPLVTQASAPHSPEFDYLIDGVNGIVVGDDSDERYALAVARLFTEPGRLAAMQSNCARDALRYSLENMVDNFVAGIVSCLRHHGRFATAAPHADADRPECPP